MPLSHTLFTTLHPLYCLKTWWINRKTRTFPRLLLGHIMNLLALWTIFTDRNDRFPYPFIYFNKWNPYPFIHLKPEKGGPFQAGSPRMGSYGEYSPPGILATQYGRHVKWRRTIWMKHASTRCHTGITKNWLALETHPGRFLGKVFFSFISRLTKVRVN